MANSWASAGKIKISLEYLVVSERKCNKIERAKEKEKKRDRHTDTQEST